VSKKTIGDLVWETKKLADITPASYNPRSISKEALAGLTSSITRFGLVEPIVWNKRTGNIVGGHQRFKVLSEQGIDETTVVVIDMPENEEIALNITLNNPAIQGDWTEGTGDLLKMINEELPDLFNSVKLDDLEKALGHTSARKSKKNEDDIPEPQKDVISQVGEMYQLGDHRLLCGDCSSPENMKRVLDGQVIGSVVSDPPYGMAFQSGHRKGTAKHEKIAGDEDAKLLVWATGLEAEHSKYLWCRWNNLVDVPMPKSLITWAKNNWSMGDLEHEHGRQTEVCLFYLGKNHFWTGKRPSDLVLHDRSGNNLHPTEKPVSLMEEVVGWTSGLVFEPFCGSGSTLIACEKLERKCCAIELNTSYCDVIRKRWAEYVHGEGCDWQQLTPIIGATE
jgi:site-specific DNA-methyltransferase (adenine-specific)